MKRQRSGIDTIEFHIQPKAPIGKEHLQFRRHKIRTARAESQKAKTFPADGQQASLNNMDKNS